MNKKGFTLIELLAVIAILAILIVLAVPNILNIFNDSKKNAFVVQAQSVYKTAETQYISKKLSPTPVASFCNAATGQTTLELEAASGLKYYVAFDSATGKISTFHITDGTYSLNKTASITSIDSITASIVVAANDSNAWAGSACN